MDVFENIQNGCEDISGLSSSTSRDENLEIVDDHPCVSAVSLVTYLNMIGEYPVTASLVGQKYLLSNITDHIVTPFEGTIELEQKRMKDTCSVADIDFEFVLDSSGSIGWFDWN